MYARVVCDENVRTIYMHTHVPILTGLHPAMWQRSSASRYADSGVFLRWRESTALYQ